MLLLRKRSYLNGKYLKVDGDVRFEKSIVGLITADGVKWLGPIFGKI